MDRISIKVGPPVEGNDFYGREKDLKYAWEYHISKGASLLLSAPRRVGKSSFSKKMLKTAEAKGWKTLYISLEGIRSESELVKFFKKELQEEKWLNKLGEKTLSLFDSIKSDKVSIDSDVWRNDTYEKIKELIESIDEILIVIDELTIYLSHLLNQEDGKEKIEFFLEWLRKFRQTSGTKARWIFCSSIGLENFASTHELSKHLNDIYPYEIGAFSENEAKDFICRLDVDKTVQFTKDNVQYILDKLVWHLPFFIQILVDRINFLICVEGKPLSNETINEAYNRLIMENHFNTWEERLKFYEYEKDARIILKLCASLGGRSREDLLANISEKRNDADEAETILAHLLKLLRDEGYLIEHNGKYTFRSPLLRDFWYERFIR